MLKNSSVSAWVRAPWKQRMSNCNRAFQDFLHDESAQDLIEYALVAALIALGAAATMRTFASTIGTALGNIGSRLTNSV
jgi:pilus assembly protein Flp/PilA